MKPFLRKTFLNLIFLLLFCFGAGVFLITTTSGMKSVAFLLSLYWHHPISYKQVTGRLLDNSHWGELRFKYQNKAFKINGLSLKWDLLSLLHQQLPIDALEAQSIEIEDHGTIYQLQHLHLKALLRYEQIKIHQLQFDYSDFNFSIQGAMQPAFPYASQGLIHFKSQSNSYTKGIITLQGDFNYLKWQGEAYFPGKVDLTGSLSQGANLKQQLQWHDINTSSISSSAGSLIVEGLLPELKIQCDAKLANQKQESWQLHVATQTTLPWNWRFNAKLTPLQSKAHQMASLFVNGLLQDPQHGQITIKTSPGFIHHELLSSILLNKGLLTANLSPTGLSGKGEAVFDTNKAIDLQFQLPQFKPSQGISAKQRFTSKVSASMDSFDFISQWIPEIKNPKGLLRLVLTGHGTLTKPHWETQLLIHKAQADIPKLGLQLKPIELTVKSTKNQFEADGFIQSKGQPLRIQGKGTLSPELRAMMTLEGSNIPVVNTHEFQIQATPKLLLDYNKNMLNISGNLLIPHAAIKIFSFSNSISLTRDAVFERQKTSYTPPLATKMDVLVTMGDNVDLTAKGLHATLTGSVQIKQTPQSAMSAVGELNVLKGQYKAYGQNLSIEQGELFFTGGAIDNPGINLRASKEIRTETINTSSSTSLLDFNSNSLQNANLRGSLTVGVEVTGRLSDPDIQLFSVPAILSQADILSMLILGRPASQANKAGGQLLLAAISSMDLGQGTNGAQLLEQLKHSLGVDFNIETNSNYNLLTNTVSDKSALVVSKSVSKRLSVGYNVGLSQTDPNVITLKYLLSKFFSIQVSTSSSNSGIDVLYTSSKK